MGARLWGEGGGWWGCGLGLGVGEGRQGGVGGSPMFQDGNKEPLLDAKPAKSNAVITLAAHSQLGGNSLLIGLRSEKQVF